MRLPSHPHPTPEGHARGRRIEGQLLEWLEDAKRRDVIAAYCQPDAAVLTLNGDSYFVEAKGQDIFKAPPFDGHGLPVAQAVTYRQFYLATKQRTLFVVWDEQGRCQRWLDQLEQGRKFDTAGTIKKPRRIYHVDGFNRAATDLR